MTTNTLELVRLILKEIANTNEFILNNRETEQVVSFKIEGKAVVKKGNDYKQIISFALPYDKMIAVLMSKLNGITVESVVKEALESNLNESEIKKNAVKALAKFKGMAERECAGKVTVKNESVQEVHIDVCTYC